MREILTGLAIILIVVLTAALVAPYFVDWNGQRAFVEARLSQALGQKVTIGGSIDVKLLPTPYLVLGQTVIGEDDGPVRLSIHHLDLELAIAPLLHGEFDVTQAKLEEPTIRVTLDEDRTLPALPDAPAFHADVAFDRVSVADGTLAIADPRSGHTFVVDDLDFDADAASLAGPFKGAGTAGADSARTKFRFATTVAQKGRAHARLTVDESAAHPGIDLDGTLALTSAGRETIRQSFDGRITISGRLRQAADEPVAWRLTGPLKANPEKATLEAGELRLGGEDAGLALAATGEADLGVAPRLALDLSAKTLDIDRLAGPPTDAGTPPPPKLPPLATIRQALAAATPPLPTTLDVAVDTATWGGDTLSNLSAHLGIGGDGPLPVKLAGDAPGGAHVGLDGTLAPAGFDGRLDLSAETLPRTIAWLAAVDPGFTMKAGDLPFQAVKLAGAVKADGAAIAVSDLALALDRSSLAGTARLALAEGAHRAKLTAVLTSDALDLDGLPDLRSLRDEAAPYDLDLKLDAKAIKVANVGDAALAAGRIHLDLFKGDGRATLRSFHADDLGGATIEAMGTLERQKANLAVSVDAKRLDEAAKLVRQLAPGGWADALVARARALAPARLRLGADWAPTADGTLAPSRVKLDGRLDATRIEAALGPEADHAGAITLNGTLDAPEGSALLRQLGFHTLPLDNLGGSRITLAAHGPADSPLETQAEAQFGATKLDLAGRFALATFGQGGSGTLELKSDDLSPLLQSLALAFPDLLGRIPAEAKAGLSWDHRGLAFDDLKARLAGTAIGGALKWHPDEGDAPALTGSLAVDRLALATLTGLALGPGQPAARDAAWSSAAFGTGLVDPPRSAVKLTAKALDLAPGLEAADASLDLGVAPNLVTMRDLKADLNQGHVRADLTLRRDGRTATLEGKLGLDGAKVDLPDIKTSLTGTLDVAGSGASALALVSSLAGTGEANAADAIIADADPGALPQIFAAVERDDLAVDADSVVRALKDATRAPLRAGTRRFGLALAGGVLAFQPRDTDAPVEAGVSSALDASLDLRKPSLDLHVTQTLHDLPKSWTGQPPAIVLAWTGPPRQPQASIDVSGFINAVAARALARETARIEAYELDIRERAFFNQRLQSERRREQDRQKAEDDARRAEAERKARLEAARVEKARAAQEAAKEAAREAAARQEAARAAQGAREPVRPPAQERPPETRRFEAPPPGGATDPSAAGRY